MYISESLKFVNLGLVSKKKIIRGFIYSVLTYIFNKKLLKFEICKFKSLCVSVYYTYLLLILLMLIISGHVWLSYMLIWSCIRFPTITRCKYLVLLSWGSNCVTNQRPRDCESTALTHVTL